MVKQYENIRHTWSASICALRGGSKGYNGWTELISSTETTVETGEPRAV